MFQGNTNARQLAREMQATNGRSRINYRARLEEKRDTSGQLSIRDVTKLTQTLKVTQTAVKARACHPDAQGHSQPITALGSKGLPRKRTSPNHLHLHAPSTTSILPPRFTRYNSRLLLNMETTSPLLIESHTWVTCTFPWKNFVPQNFQCRVTPKALHATNNQQ